MLKATYLVVTPISRGNGPTDTSIQQELSSFLSKITTDTVTSKTMLTPIHLTPHTATTIMVRHLVGDMIFTLPTMRVVTGTLLSIVTRTLVRTVTIMYGQEIIISAQVR